MNDERVAIFIDGSNLYRCLKDQFGTARIDFEQLIKKLCAGRKLLRTYYYNATLNQTEDPEGYRKQQTFFNRLSYIPYFQVKLGRLEKRPGPTWVEKGVDVTLAVDMLRGAQRDNYDTAILVSGDGDFSHVVEAVKELGKHVENAFGRLGHSRVLRDSSDRFIILDDGFLNDIWLPR